MSLVVDVDGQNVILLTEDLYGDTEKHELKVGIVSNKFIMHITIIY